MKEAVLDSGRDEERSKEEGRIIGQLEERRKQEEILWRQKSRINWLCEGERNTKFFHQAMIQHKQRNRIFSIKNAEGVRTVEQGAIEKVLVDYRKEILTEPQRDRGSTIKCICKEIPRLITNEQNKALMRAGTLEELEEIVMNMSNNKAPGPDGYTVEFYQVGCPCLVPDTLTYLTSSIGILPTAHLEMISLTLIHLSLLIMI